MSKKKVLKPGQAGSDMIAGRQDEVNRRKKRVAWLSVTSNSVLFILKLVVGIFMGSISVISEGIHSATDLLAAGIATAAVYRSSRPADEEHRYGHGKYESISGTAEAILIFIVAVWIIYEAGRKLLHPGEVELLEWGILVMLISMLVNIGVSRTLKKVAKETDSMALEADALHLSTDVWTSGGVLVGLVLIKFTGYQYIDPVIAIAVAVLIIKAAYDLTKRTFADLVDEPIPKEEEAIIRKILEEHDHVIHDYHKLRTRMSGPDRYIDLHIVVSRELGLEETHTINDHIERVIKKRITRAHILIHSEPCDGECEKCDQDEVCEELRKAKFIKLREEEGLSDEERTKARELVTEVLKSFDEVVSFHDVDIDYDFEDDRPKTTLHIIVRADLTVERTHEINHKLEDKLRYLYPEMEVIAHMEPCNGNCDDCEEEECDKYQGKKKK